MHDASRRSRVAPSRPWIALALLLACGPAGAGDVGQDVWDAWPAARVFGKSPEAMRSRHVLGGIATLRARHPALLRVLEEGRSAQGRPIPLIEAGSGPTKVLLWSQMHGDEPTATPALLDLLSHLGRTRGDERTEAILGKLTLLLIPMLNPDGAEIGSRRNAQGIDVNRDAQALQSPEGRFLKSVRDRHEPQAGFNLHSQWPLSRAGRGGPQAALTVLSVPFDDKDSEDAGRLLTKRLALTVVEAAAPWAKGRVARYDEGYTERAFGEQLSRSGTPTLLLETAGWDVPDEQAALVRLNVVVLFRCLLALAEGTLGSVDAAAYAGLPLSTGGLADVVLRGATVISGSMAPYRADIAVVQPGVHRGDRYLPRAPYVVDVGDLTVAGNVEHDLSGRLLTPAPGGPASGWKARVPFESRRARTLSEARLARAVRGWWARRPIRLFTNADFLVFRREDARVVLERCVVGGELGPCP